MPWKVAKGHGCSGGTPWAVVKSDTDEKVSCHETEEKANDAVKALYAQEGDASADTEALAKVEPDENGNCPEGHRKMPNGACLPDMPPGAKGSADVQTLTSQEPVQLHKDIAPGQWRGVLMVEGVPTGDGREFAPGSVTWADLPLPLKYQPEERIGHEGSVIVGRIDKVKRVDNRIEAEGIFDLGGEHGREAYRLTREGFLKGISVDVDDIDATDIEYVFPKESKGGDDEGGDLLDSLFGPPPEKMVFHDGRIRAATMTPMPAFVEASIELINPDEDMPAMAAAADKTEDFGIYNSLAAHRLSVLAAAVGTHDTATSDKTWDGPANEKNLPSPMPVAKARAAYAWIDNSKISDGDIPKDGGRFIHHEVSADGEVGAANLAACATGRGVIHGGRGGTTIPEADRRGVYNHLAAHERTAGREVEPYAVLVAHAAGESEGLPPAAWFENPNLSVATAITITSDGRVYGHAAEWGTCHVGYATECVQPPREDSHPYFQTGEVVCADGSRVAVGQITVGTGHAPLRAGSAAAKAHYDDTGSAVADVAVGNDKYGIWVAGAIRPGVDPARVRELQASGQVSGDWRRIGGKLRLMGLLAVNVPGFPVPRPRARVASGQPAALVAAGLITVGRGEESAEDMVQRAMQVLRNRLVARVHGGGD